MLCTSYLFAIMYQIMQNINKAALKQMLFWVLRMSVFALFIDFYFNMELIIRMGIGILELI